jgi:hypothetical protein
MARMKEAGHCDHCSRTGVLETVEVTRVGTTEPVLRLRLCTRCTSVPTATWRLRYQPVPQVTNKS